MKLLILGSVPTLNDAVLVADGLDVQKPEVTPVIVTVVTPCVARTPLGIVNVPLVAPMVSVAVFPVEVLAPLRLYVTVKVAVPIVVELTVTTEPEPEQELVAVGEVKFVMLGAFAIETPFDGVTAELAPQETTAL